MLLSLPVNNLSDSHNQMKWNIFRIKQRMQVYIWQNTLISKRNQLFFHIIIGIHTVKDWKNVILTSPHFPIWCTQPSMIQLYYFDYLKSRHGDKVTCCSEPQRRPANQDREYRERHWFFIFPRNPHLDGKENLVVKTGLTGDQLSREGCQFFLTITPFNQVIHHNDKVEPKSCLVSL